MFSNRVEFTATATAESSSTLTCQIQRADDSGNPITVTKDVPKESIDTDSAVRVAGDSGLLIVDAVWAAAEGLD
jgi:hypothetical protein